MMPNQNQWSVFKRLLTYLKPYKFLTFLALAFLLSTTVIKSIIPLVASYFIDHYLHDMNQAASLILIGYYGLYLLQTLVQYLGNLFFCACVLQHCQGYSPRCLCQYGETRHVLL